MASIGNFIGPAGARLAARRAPSVRVPCNGCRACCIGELVLVFDEDDPAQYETDVVGTFDETGEAMLALKQKPNGECVYLGPEGCTIHDRAPAICREFDCRRYFQSLTRRERRLMEKSHGGNKASIFAAARERMNTLELSDAEKGRKHAPQTTEYLDRRFGPDPRRR